MTHTYHGTCARARTGTQSWALTHDALELFTCAPGPRRYWSTPSPGLRPICAATSGMAGARGAATWNKLFAHAGPHLRRPTHRRLRRHRVLRPRRPTRPLRRRRPRARVFACAISCTLWAHWHACTGVNDDAHLPWHMCTRTHRHPIMGPYTKFDRAVHSCAGTALGLRRYWSTSSPGLRPICAATSGMVGRTAAAT
jgi:hypothetical protein